MEPLFTAETHMDAPKIKLLSQTIYDVWGSKAKITILLTGLIPTVFGFTAGISTASGMVFVLIGCLILAQINYPASRNARDVLRILGSTFPTLKFGFEENCFTQVVNSDAPSSYSYSSIIKLVERGGQLFIFPDQSSAFMIDSGSVPQGSDRLKTFLTEKTGLSWERSRSLLLLDFRTLVQNIRRAG